MLCLLKPWVMGMAAGSAAQLSSNNTTGPLTTKCRCCERSPIHCLWLLPVGACHKTSSALPHAVERAQ